jgi:DNA-binding response OmpR family regulator
MNPNSREGRSTVLVIEDEELVTMFIKEVLSDLELDVAIFTTGKSALAAVRVHRYAAAIVDLGLPDISGEEVVFSLLDQAPALPIILSSGLDPASISQRFGHLASVRILPKPYDGPQLCTYLLEFRVGKARPACA